MESIGVSKTFLAFPHRVVPSGDRQPGRHALCFTPWRAWHGADHSGVGGGVGDISKGRKADTARLKRMVVATLSAEDGGINWHTRAFSMIYFGFASELQFPHTRYFLLRGTLVNRTYGVHKNPYI